AIRQKLTRTSVLHYNWFTASQVADCTVADPRILKVHAGTFSATEFAPRPLNIVLIHLWSGRNLARVTYVPATLLQIPPLFHVSLVHHEQCQLKRLAGQPWQIRVLQKCEPLRILVPLVPVHNPIRRIPY